MGRFHQYHVFGLKLRQEKLHRLVGVFHLGDCLGAHALGPCALSDKPGALPYAYQPIHAPLGSGGTAAFMALVA